MRIAIVGAGNLGTAIAADLARKHDVKIYTSKPELFSEELQYLNQETGASFSSKIILASNQYEEVVGDAQIVFITQPTFLIKQTVEIISSFLPVDCAVCFVPGAGGIEYLANSLIRQRRVVFGFERVPYIARVKEYGRSVLASKKAKYRIAALPSIESDRIAKQISYMFDRPCEVMKEFISMTLTPTLHTSRLYDLYGEYIPGEPLNENPFFYREWRDSASQICFNLDSELHKVCAALCEAGISAQEVVPYSIHYESATPELLTKKLRSIKSLRDIKGPVFVTDQNEYSLDINSRYFTESYPYRLCIVRAIADLLGINVPETDKVLKWYCHLAGKEYYVENRLVGKDIQECNIPQNYGIDSIDKLRMIYEF